ncbi:MAG: tetratricopeptide repeat protein, partial [Ktedonobacteraceae bacterium]
SQREVAARLGTTQHNVSRWERGQTVPSSYFRAKLCDLFGKSVQELGLLAEQPTSEKAEMDVLALWTIPYPRNRHFTGREDLLNQLERQLSPQAHSASPTTTLRAALTQPQAIKGLGGIGKTQIAVEYAYRAREQGHYTHTFWINAASEEAMITSFVQLAELLPAFPAQTEQDQHKLVAAIKRWLEHCPQRWLLIFDNADDLALLDEYLSTQGHGSLLLTTRAHAVGALAAPIEVEKMGFVEGVHLLLHRAQRLAHASDEEINEAGNIVVALDHFPLALDQAGAYIEETACPFSTYLHLYQEHRQALLARRGSQATHYPDSVATTWALSFQKIAQMNPAAIELLHLCAFLAPDAIPEELFRDGAVHWPPLLQRATKDQFLFNQMLEDALKFSLIERFVNTHTLRIHRLVQAVQIDRMEREEQHHWAACVVRAVNEVFPRQPKEDIASWPQCLRYLEQAQACDALIKLYTFEFTEAADILHRTGIYLREHASPTIAKPLLERALAIREQQFGVEHLETATCLNDLAILYFLQGKYEQAESPYLRALHIREQQLGTEHPETAMSLHHLAKLYQDQGKYEQVESFYQRALAILEQQLGTEHPETAATLDDLASFYQHQGKYEQAELLHQRALTTLEQQLGTKHPLIVTCLSNLAKLYLDQGKYEQAEPLLQRALHIREWQLGAEHPETATSLNNLASLYFLQGKYEQAEPFCLRTLTIYEQQLGAEHPFIASSLNNLATLYRRQGKYE